MNLKYYEVFTRVYERMNMSVVADEMFMSQPAVSRIIRELENHYETRFFLRHAGRLYRSKAGERFYPYAKELLNCEEQVRLAMNDQKKLRRITLGASPTAGSYYLPQILQTYRENCNELNILLFSGPPAMLEQQLLDARMEIAVVEGTVKSWELTSVPLFEDDLIFVAAADRPCPDRNQPLRLLIRDAGEMERQEFEHSLRDAKINFTIQGQFVEVEGIKRCAACGHGIGLVPRRSVDRADNLVELDLGDLQLKAKFSLVYHRDRFLFPQLKTLVRQIGSMLSNQTEIGGIDPSC